MAAKRRDSQFAAFASTIFARTLASINDKRSDVEVSWRTFTGYLALASSNAAILDPRNWQNVRIGDWLTLLRYGALAQPRIAAFLHGFTLARISVKQASVTSLRGLPH